MKISLLSASIVRLGGAEAIVRLLAEGLADRGHEVQVISLDREAYPEGSQRGFNHCPISSKATDKYADRDSHGSLYKAYWQLRCRQNRLFLSQLEKTLKAHRPHVIHTHKVKGFPLALWPSLKKYSDSVLVHTCHDIELLSPLHSLSMTSSNPVNKVMLNAWARGGIKPSAHVDAVTSPSRFMLDLHLRKGFFDGAASRVVSNFPDLVHGYRSSKLNNPDIDDPLKILFIGRLVQVKGILALCEAVKKAVDCGQKIQLRIAGDGPLQAIVNKYTDLHPFIHAEGLVEGRAKSSLFEWCHIVAVPARCDEAFCLVAAEAITAGKPVLASNRGALPEVVSDGITGWVCEGDNVDELLAGLQRAQESRGHYAEFSANCIRESKRFEAGRLIDTYEEFYSESREN